MDYYKFIFQYGILTILIVLDYLINNEDYEECQEIEIAISKCESRLNLKFKRTIDGELLQLVESNYKKFGLTEENIFSNSLVYAESILNDLGYSQITFNEIEIDE